jgi:hypothetical protein
MADAGQRGDNERYRGAGRDAERGAQKRDMTGSWGRSRSELVFSGATSPANMAPTVKCFFLIAVFWHHLGGLLQELEPVWSPPKHVYSRVQGYKNQR